MWYFLPEPRDKHNATWFFGFPKYVKHNVQAVYDVFPSRIRRALHSKIHGIKNAG